MANLSKELDTWMTKYNKIKPKGALADGALVSFDQAKRFPTRAEAFARTAAMVIGPAGRLLSQLRGPASTVAGQIKQVAEKKPEGEPAAA